MLVGGHVHHQLVVPWFGDVKQHRIAGFSRSGPLIEEFVQGLATVAIDLGLGPGFGADPLEAAVEQVVAHAVHMAGQLFGRPVRTSGDDLGRPLLAGGTQDANGPGANAAHSGNYVVWGVRRIHSRSL